MKSSTARMRRILALSVSFAVAAGLSLVPMTGLAANGGAGRGTAAAPQPIPANIPKTGFGVINNSCGPQYEPFLTDPQYQLADVSMSGGTLVWLNSGDYVETGTWVRWASVEGSVVVLDMDWSDDGGANWHSCQTGPSGGSAANDGETWAVDEVSGRVFRACGYQDSTGWRCTAFEG